MHTDLNHPDLIPILMPPLMRKWNLLKDDDRNLFPLLECLTAIAQALGKGFFVFAEPVFERSMLIIEKNLIQEKEAVRLITHTHTHTTPFQNSSIDRSRDLASFCFAHFRLLVF